MPTVIIKKYHDRHEVEVFLGYAVGGNSPMYEVTIFTGLFSRDSAIEFAKSVQQVSS